MAVFVKQRAWWFLTREQRKLLRDMRMQGRFGGIAGKAPYWMIQEAGEPSVGIEAKFYIDRAVESWERIADVVVDEYFNP